MAQLKTFEVAKQELLAKHPNVELLTYTKASSKISYKVISCGCQQEYPTFSSLYAKKAISCLLHTRVVGQALPIDVAREELSTAYPNLELLEYTKASDPSVIRYVNCGCTKTVPMFTKLMNRGHNSVCRQHSFVSDNLNSFDEAKQTIEDKFPDIELVEYTRSIDPTKLIHKKCGTLVERTTFKNALKRGFSCPTCYPRGVSKGEKDLVDFIRANYDGWVIENDRVNIAPRELDILLPDLGLAIEYNGEYWHSEEKVGKDYHLDKLNAANEADLRLIQITDREWNTKQEIVKSRLLGMLGKSTKLHARKCEVREIPYPSEFLEANHIQGKGVATSINYGLFFENELVSVMTFGTSRYDKAYDYELIRFCTKLGFTVVGGASKLFAYFNNHNVGSIMSYADRRWSEGGVYKQLGFTLSHNSDPGYYYYKGSSYLSRYQCQKHKLKALLPDFFNEELSESKIMELAGYTKVYDCGNSVWVYQ